MTFPRLPPALRRTPSPPLRQSLSLLDATLPEPGQTVLPPPAPPSGSVAVLARPSPSAADLLTRMYYASAHGRAANPPSVFPPPTSDAQPQFPAPSFSIFLYGEPQSTPPRRSAGPCAR